MEKEEWKYQVWVGNDLMLETFDQAEALSTFYGIPVGQVPSKRRALIRTITMLEDGEQ